MGEEYTLYFLSPHPPLTIFGPISAPAGWCVLDGKFCQPLKQITRLPRRISPNGWFGWWVPFWILLAKRGGQQAVEHLGWSVVAIYCLGPDWWRRFLMVILQFEIHGATAYYQYVYFWKRETIDQVIFQNLQFSCFGWPYLGRTQHMWRSPVEA